MKFNFHLLKNIKKQLCINYGKRFMKQCQCQREDLKKKFMFESMWCDPNKIQICGDVVWEDTNIQFPYVMISK